MRVTQILLNSDGFHLSIEYEKDGENHLLVTSALAIVKDHEAAQQSVQADEWVCTCKFPSPANDRMGEYCRLCGKPTRR